MLDINSEGDLIKAFDFDISRLSCSRVSQYNDEINMKRIYVERIQREGIVSSVTVDDVVVLHDRVQVSGVVTTQCSVTLCQFVCLPLCCSLKCIDCHTPALLYYWILTDFNPC